MTTIDTRSVALAIMADLMWTAPLAFVVNVLQTHAIEMTATIQRHLDAAIMEYHRIVCSHEDPITDCLCQEAVKEILHYEPGRERN